jgi:O-antigen ligase
MSDAATGPVTLRREPVDPVLALRGLFVIGALLLVWISTEPFKGVNQSEALSGNVLNQVAFSITGAFAIVCLFMIDRRALTPYARPVYILLIAWMGISVLLSHNFAVSLRAYAFSMVVLLVGATILVMPAGQRHFARLLGAATLIILAVSYLGLIAFPEEAMHTAADLNEPEHAGLWRGPFDHKNLAGAMMVIYIIVGLYVARAWSVAFGWAIVVLSAIFLFFSFSKTSIALVPVVLMASWLGARTRSLALRMTILIGPVLLFLLFTVGTVLLPQARAVVDAVSPGQTYTGRTAIWSFAFEKASERLSTGYGFEGFWGSDQIRFGEASQNTDDIASGMVHGHNGYVDALIGMGLPGLALMLTVLGVLPVVDHYRARLIPDNAMLAELFIRIWLFASYNACLESFFFRRADPVWFSMLLAVLGLRLISVYRVAR